MALRISRGIAFPKTHDLVVLFNLAVSECDLNLEVQEVQPLNRYCVEARYPGDWDPITMQEATGAVTIARCVREPIRCPLPNDALRAGE